jgi:hypothetical protein
MKNFSLLAVLLLGAPAALLAQGRFPPDSLVNVKVIPRNTPVQQVLGMMRGFAGALGVRCVYCHVGEEGQPLDRIDFASDQKRAKVVARQMILLVQEINRRVDSLPIRPVGVSALPVTCTTCHRGVSRPVPLATMVADAGQVSADSAVRVYQALRERYYGRDSYDFGEGSLNTAALNLSRARKFDEALAVLKTNEEQFPRSSAVATVRGNVLLQRGDTSAAADAFREAIRRDSTNAEARGRLRAIGRPPQSQPASPGG